MSEYTNNYNLIKPKKSENYDINDVTRTNADILDTTLYQKVDKIIGKGLSTNDFTTEYKKKIDTLQTLYRFKGTVENLEELYSKTENNIGDVWSSKEDNNNYCWNKEEWINIGKNKDLADLLDEIDKLNTKLDNLSKIYKGTRIIAPTCKGFGKLVKIYGKTEKVGNIIKNLGESSENEFDGTLIGGTVVNGVPNTDMNTTRIRNNDYIEINANQEYMISADYSNTLQIMIFLYDSSQNLIKSSSNWNNINHSFKTTNNTKYLMFVFRDSQNSTITASNVTNVELKRIGELKIVSKNEEDINTKIINATRLCCIKDLDNNIVAQDYIDFVKNIVHRECGYIVSYNNETISSNYISSTGTLSVGATVVYKLKNSIEEDFICNDSLVQYQGETNIYNTDNAEMEVSLTQNKTISDINNNISNVKQKTIKLEKKINESNYSENWKTLQPGVFYRKVGTDVEVRFDIENLNKTINGYSNLSFGMMPEGYMPKEPVRIAVFSINTIGVYPLHILINPTYYNGYVNLYNPYANNLTIKEVYGFVKYSIL